MYVTNPFFFFLNLGLNENDRQRCSELMNEQMFHIYFDIIKTNIIWYNPIIVSKLQYSLCSDN